MRRSVARTSALWLPVAAGWFVGCDLAIAPSPEGTHRISAPPIFRVWWSLTQACSGRTSDLSSVDWHVVPGVAQFTRNHVAVSGYWSRDGNRIVLAERAMLDGGLVRHEMLHALVGEGGHSREAFLERCGGTVVCLTGCLEDLGRLPIVGANVARVAPHEMRIDIAVDPIQPQRFIDDGHFRLVVTVTNPRADSVVVLLPSSGDAPPASFSFQLESGPTGLWFTEHAWDPGVMVFGPGATRRAIFDFRLADRFDGVRALPEGTYDVLGGFGPAKSEVHTFVFGRTQ